MFDDDDDLKAIKRHWPQDLTPWNPEWREALEAWVFAQHDKGHTTAEMAEALDPEDPDLPGKLNVMLLGVRDPEGWPKL